MEKKRNKNGYYYIMEDKTSHKKHFLPSSGLQNIEENSGKSSKNRCFYLI